MTSPYKRIDEAALYLRYTHNDGTPNNRSCLLFLRRKNVPLKRRGAALLVHIDDLDNALEDAQARRRAS